MPSVKQFEKLYLNYKNYKIFRIILTIGPSVQKTIIMKSSPLMRFCFSTFNKPTILQSLRSYKNSPAQSHLHDYIRSEAELQKIKKQKIDYDFITKESAGVMMFREFAFQEKTEETLVSHLDCELPPSGAWTFQQIKKELGEYDHLTRTEAQNIEIMEECQTDIEKAIKQFYDNVGKKNYQFNLQEQINKINQMTEDQFRHYAKTLHNKQIASLQEPTVKEKSGFKSAKRTW